MYLSELYKNLDKYTSLNKDKFFSICGINIERVYGYINDKEFDFVFRDFRGFNKMTLKKDTIGIMTPPLSEINKELIKLIRQEKIKKLLN